MVMMRKQRMHATTILIAMLLTLTTTGILQAATTTEDDHHKWRSEKSKLEPNPIGSAATTGLFDTTIGVTNKLSSGMALILHCESGDDDLGGRAVEANATYEFTFGMTLDTLFWCKAAFRDRRLSFVAFGQVNVKHFDVSDGGVDGVDEYSGDRVHVCDWN